MSKTDPNGNRIKLLRYELEATKEHLQNIIEDKDDVNQELWASNEEVQSTNEELQSVNEEMEAAKEELESGNEELIALNEELNSKNFELIETKEFAENLVDTANTIIVTLDVNACITTFNSFAEELTGRTKSEVLGKNWFDLFIPNKDKENLPKVFKDVLDNMPNASNHENSIITESGEERLVSWNNTTIHDNSKNITGILSIGIDITEQKIVEDALKESEEKLSALFDTMTEMVVLHEVVFDSNDKAVDYMITDCNKTFTTVTGIAKKDAIGKLATIVYQASSAPYFDEYSKVAITGKPYTFYTYYPPMGKHFMISVVSPGKNKFATITTDITLIKETEKNLQESEGKFRRLTENAKDTIFRMSLPDRIFEFVSEASYEIFGYTPEEFYDDKNLFSHIIHPDWQNYFENEWKNIFAGNMPPFYEYQIIHKSGEIRWLNQRDVLIKDNNNNPIAIEGIVTDITIRKQSEEEKEKLQGQLRQSDKMQAIGQLAGGIAHDFNNQLAGILGFADILREELSYDMKLSHYTDNIILSTKRASDLTAQLLAFARKGKYLSVAVDIHRIILEVVNLLSRSIDKRIIIKQELRANPATVMGDPTQLQNAILNIVINARDAMPDGGVIKFSTDIIELNQKYCDAQSHEIEPGKYLFMCISDTGVGIDKDTSSHIFEPFFTTKDVGKGSGMGLAAVYGTIKNHKGCVNVKSKLNQGTTFELHLPFVTNPEKAVSDLTNQKSIKGSAHILFVDDEDMICDVAVRMMEKLGYSVSVCRNGNEAIEFYKDHWQTIDLVILDMIMPETDGEEAFKIMYKINPDIVVLVSSGYSIDGKAQRVLDLGAKEFIQKPYRKGNLSQKISKVLKK